ncbi:MAG: hypothetical protein AAF962_11365 [Actinomycetota bacterium]
MQWATLRDRLIGGALAVAALAVAAMWLPWFRSGEAAKNSFDAFRAAQILGIEWVSPFRVVWFLVPVVVLAAGCLLAFRRRGWAAAAVLVASVLLAAFGVLALVSIGVFPGSVVATVAGVGAAALAGCGVLVADVAYDSRRTY